MKSFDCIRCCTGDISIERKKIIENSITHTHKSISFGVNKWKKNTKYIDISFFFGFMNVNDTSKFTVRILKTTCRNQLKHWIYFYVCIDICVCFLFSTFFLRSDSVEIKWWAKFTSKSWRHLYNVCYGHK